MQSNPGLISQHMVTQNTAGVTSSAGTAGTLTKVVEYQIQPGHKVIIDRDAVLMLYDKTATVSLQDQGAVQVVLVDARKKSTFVVEDTFYSQVKRNADTRVQHHPIRGSHRYILQPFSFFQIWVNSLAALSASSLDFMLEAKEQPISS